MRPITTGTSALRTHRKIAILTLLIAAPTALFAAAFTNGNNDTGQPTGVRSKHTETAPFGLPVKPSAKPHVSPNYRLAQLTASASKTFVKPVRTTAIKTPAGSPLSQIADAIHVRFQGYKDLNGAYRLNEDETVSIPGVGRISIAGMTASHLERALAKRIMGSTGRHVSVSVEVSTYRHVFVDGVVDKPGSFQWQRGMTVVKAVSMTGGIYRPRVQAGRYSSPVAQRGRLDIARLKLAQALVRQARLTAELQNRKLLKSPERLIGIFGRNRAYELIENEQTILDNRRATAKARLRALEAQQNAISSEVLRLKSLAKGMASRTKSYSRLLVKLRRTHRSGGISNRRLFEVEARLGDLEEKLASTNVQLVRARSSQQLLESKRAELVDTRRERLVEDDIKTRAAIGAHQIEYDVALDMVGASGGANATAKNKIVRKRQPVYEIIRRTPKGEQRMAAKPLDLLLPGDTLVVSHALPDPKTIQ